MRTITWDYDKNVATEWCRLGDCNHCGECCQVIIYIDACGDTDEDRRNGGNGVSEEGQWYQCNGSGNPLFWGNIRITTEPIGWDCYEGVADDDIFIDEQGERCPTSSIAEEQRGQCNHGSKRKEGICTAWPLHPDHVNEFDDCSYRFLKLNEWEMEEDHAIETG